MTIPRRTSLVVRSTRFPAWVNTALATTISPWSEPFRVNRRHPLITEQRTCYHCTRQFQAGDMAVVVRIHLTDDKLTWIATHEGCLSAMVIH